MNSLENKRKDLIKSVKSTGLTEKLRWELVMLEVSINLDRKMDKVVRNKIEQDYDFADKFVKL